MEEYWKALIRGLAVEDEKELSYYWKIPLGVSIVFLIFSLL